MFRSVVDPKYISRFLLADFRKENSMKKAIAILLSAVQLIGCSAFAGRKQSVTVTTNVPSAQIFANGELVGTGNTSFKARRNKDLQLVAKADGYHEAYHHIDTELSTTGILDIVGIFFFLVPVVGLFTPGSRTLEQRNVAMHLEKGN